MTLIATAYEGGWLAVATDDGEPQVRMRVEARNDGRLRIVELWLTSPDGLTGTSLRNLPLGQWEALVNQERFAEALKKQLDTHSGEGNLHLEAARARFVPIVPSWWRRGDTIFFHVSAELEPSYDAEPQLELQIPPGRRRPDDFYRQAAEAYSWLAGRSRHPAVELAERNHVPETTVHRWIKEARRRGLLGPGRLRNDNAEDR